MDIAKVKMQAELGYAEAQFALGMAYYNGAGLPQSYGEAFRWLGLAAEQEHGEALHNLAIMYEKGQGCARDFIKAGELYARARLQKQDEGTTENNELGEAYAAGEVPELAPEDEFALLLKAAEAGNVEAQAQVGGRYYEGNGVEQNYTESLKWFERAAEQNNAKAQYNLGVMYLRGYGVEKNKQQAFEWLKKAAEQGLACAQYNLGMCYDTGCGVEYDPCEAVKWYTLAANQNDARAKNNLGNFYLYGTGVAKDYAKAFELFEAALKYGDVEDAANGALKANLGFMYFYGLGCVKNYAKAFEFYNKAATSDFNEKDFELYEFALENNVRAKASLGFMYYKGLGVPENYAKALEYFTAAAQEGHADAQYNLGYMYLKGHGVKQSDKEGFKWICRAAHNGSQAARHKLSFLYFCGRGTRTSRMRAYMWRIIAGVNAGCGSLEERPQDKRSAVPAGLVTLSLGVISACSGSYLDLGKTLREDICECNLSAPAWRVGGSLQRWYLRHTLNAQDIKRAQQLAAEFWETPYCPWQFPVVVSITREAGLASTEYAYEPAYLRTQKNKAERAASQRTTAGDWYADAEEYVPYEANTEKSI